jgi:hypothetical protein
MCVKRSSFLRLLFALVLTGSVWAATAFAGTWTGSYTNESGEVGSDRMTLSEGANGEISGDWAGMPVTGQRANPDSFDIWGSTAKRSYQGIGRVSNGVLTVDYTANRLDTGGSYRGRSVLRRP